MSHDDYNYNYFFDLHPNKRGYLICNGSLLFIPSTCRNLVVFKQHKHDIYTAHIDDPPKEVVEVADCYMTIDDIFLMPSIKQKRVFIVTLCAVPCKKIKGFNDYNAISIKVTVSSNGLQFNIKGVIRHAVSLKLHIYNEKHFHNALYDLLYEEIYHNKYTYMPYFNIGYKSDAPGKFALPYNAEKQIFLPCTDDNISIEDTVNEVTEYIKKQPSAGMLLTYTFLSITYFFFDRYWQSSEAFRIRFNGHLILPVFHYYGDNLRDVYRDVNLFSNMFNASTYKTVTGRENIILNSAGYDIDNHVAFKDIPLVVTTKKVSLSANNRLLKELISLKSENRIPFFPVVISEKKLSFAEVVSVKCDNTVILSQDEYKNLKKHINTLLFRIIKYIDTNHHFIDEITEMYLRNQTLDTYLKSTNDYDAVAYMLMSYALNIISDVLSQLDDKYTHHNLIEQLRNTLAIQMVDDTLIDPNYGTHTSQLPDYINHILDFVKETYTQHKDDNPQRTVWSEAFNDKATGKFNPFENDRRYIYIDKHLVDEFICQNICKKESSLKKIKSLLYKHSRLRKNDRRYVFKKHSHGEIYCYCFYIEFE